MGLFSEIFIWWHGQTMGTRFYTWRKGRLVGEDGQGNRYYEAKDGREIGGYVRNLLNDQFITTVCRRTGMAGCITPWIRRPTKRTTRPASGSSLTCPISPAPSMPIARPAACTRGASALRRPATTRPGGLNNQSSAPTKSVIRGAPCRAISLKR